MNLSHRFITAIFLLLISCAFFSCSDSNQGKEKTSGKKHKEKPKEPVSAVFEADSAFAFIEKQLAFGPRIPNTAAHKACAEWLKSKLTGYTPHVILQTGNIKAWDGEMLDLNNVIASFNPEKNRRIALFAHWDTRPFADQDPNDPDKAFDGANDGASGVGILLEIARQLSLQPINMGIDLILLDLEDYGNSDFEDSYCLGSQYWSKTPHVKGYSADYGILLDMVGARSARFNREGISMHFAPHIVERVWKEAADLGYTDWFIYNDEPYPTLIDDHLYINQIIGIPTIDIIEYDKDTPKGFGSFWHTHDDNVSIIDKTTLKAVGHTLISLIRKEDRGVY